MTKKEKYNLYITYDENSIGGEETDGVWSTRTPLYRTIKWKNAYIEHPDQLYTERVEDIDFNPKKQEYVYIVVVTYEDGDTFGNSYGNWHLVGAYKSTEDAQKIIKQIETDEYNANKKDQYKNYKPWKGYFATFTDVELFKINII